MLNSFIWLKILVKYATFCNLEKPSKQYENWKFDWSIEILSLSLNWNRWVRIFPSRKSMDFCTYKQFIVITVHLIT
jgi:hypothetical protein